MKPTLVLHELTDIEGKRLCCRHDFIKQEAAGENFKHVDALNPGTHPQAMTIKSKTPEDELDDITVKEEPIDWDQEPQVSSSPVSSALTFKREVDEACAEAHAGPTEEENKVREGGSGACNTSTVHPQSAGASQESTNSLAPDVFCASSDVEVRPPEGHVTQPPVCELCDSATVRKDSLRYHLCSEHQLGVSSKGELSDNSCSDLIRLKRSAEMTHSKNLFQCQACNYCCADRNMVRQHELEKHSSGKQCKCKSSDNFSVCSSDSNTHQIGKHGKNECFECELCEYSSATKSNLKRHQASKHGGRERFKCEFCDYFSARRDHLRGHEACKHGRGELFKCEFCEYSGLKHQLKKHKASKHGKGELFKCEFCEYSSAVKGHLKVHRASKHEKGERFKCEVCDYSSVQKNHLREHEASKHGRGELFKCEFCEYSSAVKANLRVHQASKHEKGDLFKCEVCD
ncbi:Zinc finger C2H2-type [Trinorchestia longiramus]|nr:Zinc finger C2H2-type [Trinorchestia longiramus]